MVWCQNALAVGSREQGYESERVTLYIKGIEGSHQAERLVDEQAESSRERQRLSRSMRRSFSMHATNDTPNSRFSAESRSSPQGAHLVLNPAKSAL